MSRTTWQISMTDLFGCSISQVSGPVAGLDNRCAARAPIFGWATARADGLRLPVRLFAAPRRGQNQLAAETPRQYSGLVLMTARN